MKFVLLNSGNILFLIFIASLSLSSSEAKTKGKKAQNKKSNKRSPMFYHSSSLNRDFNNVINDFSYMDFDSNNPNQLNAQHKTKLNKKRKSKTNHGHKNEKSTANHQNKTKKKRIKHKKSVPSLLRFSPYLRNNCTFHACYPPIKNLLVGRKKFLYASSTCGLEIPERFCILGHIPRDSVFDSNSFLTYIVNDRVMPSHCFTCDSQEEFDKNPNSHRVENIVHDYKHPNKGREFQKWWQSSNGIDNVFIQFDLEAYFVLSHVLMRFKTYPPLSMYFEKSSDFGQTWQTLVYFADKCEESFPGASTVKPINLNQPYCINLNTNKQSSNNEVVYRPLSGMRVQMDPVYLQNSLKITNFRVNLTKLYMFGDDLIDKSDESMSKYFYAVNEMKLLGSCFCNGHASECIQARDIQYDKESINEMIHSVCKCEHNTHGQNCEKCLALYNDRPWLPGRYDQTNECRKCNCHNHATSCRFDSELYRLSNGSTGGICENCMHNTEGYNCERCKRNFYRDTSVPFESPFACKPCKCNAIGTINRNPFYDEPGCRDRNCECKLNVEGENCDRCKNGYFNLSLAHHNDGCQKCDCHVEGTLDNLGCNKFTGECFSCKTHVTGKRCDQCKPGYFGLDSSKEGCQPCNCAPGNSYSNQCNPVTGQCSCKPHTHGRRCNLFDEGFYCPSPDHIVFEAEDSYRVNNNSHLHERIEAQQAEKSWTGTGYMKVYDGGKLKFNLNHNYSTGVYDIVMRYEADSYDMQDVHVRITNLGTDLTKYNSNKKSNKFCSDLRRDQNAIEEISIRIEKFKRYGLLFSMYCFEEFSNYELELSFHHTDVRRARSAHYNSAKNTPNVFIDSIVLIPDLHFLINSPNQDDLAKNRVIETAHMCRDRYFGLPRAKDPFCDKAICQITIDVFGLLACGCDTVGSNNNNCEFHGGQCSCKQNVHGRRCNTCRPTSWGFSVKGCQSCNCDSSGSKNDICDVNTGQCDCYDNKQGKTCSDCLNGYYGPPTCEKCNCQGFAENCSSVGVCIDCKGNTEGYYCDKCKLGYYGNPTAGVACKKCACPGINGNNFAQDCSYNENADAFDCNCLPGYVGDRCEKCDRFHYGSPLEIGGSCKKCFCNGNEDKSNPMCDSKTGQCKNCQFGTDGFFCEKCKPGFFGNAREHTCKPCNCNPHGTEGNSKDNCDPDTGICFCLPKVIGRKCDECAADYWKLENGEGCLSCDCDKSGTYENSTWCDQNTGQCNCLETRGGKTCNECPFGYWGTPLIGCKKCQCVPEGVESTQCDRNDGHCICRPGVTGYYCDRCSRGTIGKAPICRKCGECFDSWDEIIVNLNGDLDKLEKKAINIYASLGLGKNDLTDFNSEYDKLADKLSDVYSILNLNTTVKDKNITALTDNLNAIKNKIDKMRDTFDKKLKSATEWNAAKKVIHQRERYSLANNETDRLLKIAIDLKESLISGAQTSIRNSKELSDVASEMVEESTKMFEREFEKTLNELKSKLASLRKKINFNNNKSLSFVNSSREFLKQMEDKLVELNSFVCGASTLDCSNKCGAIQCDKCGYFNETDLESSDKEKECSNGLESSYLKLIHYTNTFKDAYESRETELKKYLSKINQNKLLFKKINDDVMSLNKNINTTVEEFEIHKNLIANILASAYKFGDKYIMDSQAIESKCEYALNLNLTLSESDFDTIVEKINKLTTGLKTSINSIKSETEIPLASATNLYTSVFKELESDEVNPNEIDEHINETISLMHAHIKTNNELKSVSVVSQEAIETNTQINKTLIGISLNLTKLNENSNLVEEVLNTNKVDLDYQMNTIDHENIKIKIKTLTWSNEHANEKLNIISKELEKLLTSINDSENLETKENISLLIDLQNRIANKNRELKAKSNKVKDHETKNNELKLRLDTLKQDLESLTLTTKNLKTEISDKLSFIKSCQ